MIGKATPKWRDIGTELLDDSDTHELDTLELDYRRNNRRCCKEMFRNWIANYDTNATWNRLLEALRLVGLKALAVNVKQGTIM